ncbi:hypothetical protein EYF80_016112 [Liparis tanakae]|uniref:Uncharacterized protein n=1 Tax=Liparis tanakae TaxID=230148 RepID=A0A4Z2I8L9_9TELE|nr:hypothetical protein EYF80_016112 [Liparis tanakae]
MKSREEEEPEGSMLPSAGRNTTLFFFCFFFFFFFFFFSCCSFFSTCSFFFYFHFPAVGRLRPLLSSDISVTLSGSSALHKVTEVSHPSALRQLGLLPSAPRAPGQIGRFILA